MKKAINEPIVLSGRVYFEGFLAEVAGFAAPSTTLVGDIRMHNVNKPGKRSRFGQTVEFSGFYSASVYDGKRWRRLLLRRHAAVDASYVGAIARRDKAHACRSHLLTLSGRTAVWVKDDSGYEVTYSTQSTVSKAASKAPAQAPAVAKAPQPAAASKPAAEAAAPVVEAAAVAEATASVAEVKTVPCSQCPALKKRRVRRRKPNPNQMELFQS